MILVKPIGGLGNQLFQIAYAIELARKTNRTIYIDKSTYETYKIRKYSIDNLKVSDIILDIKESEIKYSRIGIYWLPLFYRVFQKIIKTFITKNNFEDSYCNLMSKFGLHFNFDNFYHSYKLRSKVIYVYGYFQSENYFSDSKLLIFEKFLSKNIDVIKGSSLGKKIINENSLAISLRLGDDYLKSKDHFVCDENYFKKALNKFDVHNVHLFVFSDENERAKEIILKMNLDLDKVTFVTGYSETDGLMLMSLCKNFILSNSSFSWWGAYLSKNNDKRVIAPSTWYAYDSDRVAIYTDSMELI
ncbi:alpha-1,2-fucosyltransferase [Vibrio cyclitrophicus]